MARLSIELLGTFRAALDGVPVTGFESNKVRALLAYLASESDRAHGRETLAGLLWPDRPDRQARRNLSQALSNLRRAIGDRDASPPFLTITPQALAFNPSSDRWLDVAAFEELLEDCQAHDHGALASCDLCIDSLQHALALCRGPFLEGLSLPDGAPFEEWALLEGERLRRLEVRALRSAAECLAERGEYDGAVEYLERWTHLEPWDEAAHRELMRVYSASGRRSAALRQYRECVRVLDEELGLAPAAQTQALHEQILAQAAETADVSSIPPRPRHNLPPQAMPFVGREAMVADIEARLADPACRMLTLVGPGGSGKTRLAIEVGSQLVDSYQDGVIFVGLAGVSSEDGVAPAIAQAISLPLAQGKPEQQLIRYLRNRQMLLIIDNFEHLLPRPDQVGGDALSLLIRIVDSAPRVKLLVTSRAALRSEHEQRFPVTGMACPEDTGPSEGDLDAETAAAFSAVALFAQTARRADPAFVLDEENLQSAAHICRAVSGMPLGILLAASWVRMLSAADLASQMEAGLDLLETDLRDVPRRQRSMRAVLDHSWGLLTPRERELMESFSVFRGGFTRQAAREVSGATLSDLRALVDRSLVQPGAGARFQVHELLRQYAAQGLSRSAAAQRAARDKHAAYYADRLQNLKSELEGPRYYEALDEMDVEVDNMRAAWNWAADQGQVDLLARAIEPLANYHLLRGRSHEGDRAFADALRRLEEAGSLAAGAEAETLLLMARLLGERARVLQELDRHGQGEALLERALALLRRPELTDHDTRSLASFLYRVLGTVQRVTGQPEYRKTLERSLSLAESAGDRRGILNVVDFICFGATMSGEYRESLKLREQCITIARELGDTRLVATDSAWAAFGHVMQGRVEHGERLAREALAELRRLGNPVDTAHGLLNLGIALVYGGKYAEGQRVWEERAKLWTDLGTPANADRCMLGQISLEQGRYGEARSHLLSAYTDTKQNDDLTSHAHSNLELGRLAIASGAYAEAAVFLEKSLHLLEKYAYRDWIARAHGASAYAARGLGDGEAARSHIVAALGHATERGSYLALLEGLPAAAYLLLDQDDLLAIEVYELARTLPAVANSRWAEDVVGRPVARAAARLPLNAVEAARARGRSRDTETTCHELIELFSTPELTPDAAPVRSAARALSRVP